MTNKDKKIEAVKNIGLFAKKKLKNWDRRDIQLRHWSFLYFYITRNPRFKRTCAYTESTLYQRP